jgi:hypothetical protein
MMYALIWHLRVNVQSIRLFGLKAARCLWLEVAA